MSKQTVKANNKCQRNNSHRFNNSNASDVLSMQAKELIVAAASVILGINSNGGQHCSNCNVVDNIYKATQQPMPCHHPIQMKPADTENRNERKLFAGMLSKSLNEQEVRSLFAPFGTIEECTILRDNNGQSKGCAFITFSSRSSAANAIKQLNHSTTMEGCTSSLVVKFADTQKDKDSKKGGQSLIQQLWSQATNPLTASSLTSNPYLTLAALTAAQQQQQQQQQLAAALSLQQQYLNSDLVAFASNPVLMAAALTGSPHTKITPQTSTTNVLNQRINSSKLGVLNTNQLTFPTPLSTSPLATVQQLTATVNTNTVSSSGKQLEGPDGANLFIYHLPPEFTDADLISTFSPFGNVISAKVFIDKNSNLSKCFGFVSYDNALSAQSAIQSMHGFQIRNKRLKVQLKKTRDKPY